MSLNECSIPRCELFSYSTILETIVIAVIKFTAIFLPNEWKIFSVNGREGKLALNNFDYDAKFYYSTITPVDLRVCGLFGSS